MMNLVELICRLATRPPCQYLNLYVGERFVNLLNFQQESTNSNKILHKHLLKQKSIIGNRSFSGVEINFLDLLKK